MLNRQMRGFIWCVIGFAGVLPIIHQNQINPATMIWGIICIILIYTGLFQIHQPLKNSLQKYFRNLEKN